MDRDICRARESSMEKGRGDTKAAGNVVVVVVVVDRHVIGKEGPARQKSFKTR